MDKPYVIIGYSGHAYVVCDILIKSNQKVIGYCENKEKIRNPFNLRYFGREAIFDFSLYNAFVAIGNNKLRKKIFKTLDEKIAKGQAYHPFSQVGYNCRLGTMVMLAANSVVNSLTTIGDGTIVNTGAIIEHECSIGTFSHLGPGAVLAGNVTVGNLTFIGANSVIKQGVNIGNDVTIGAGSVILKDIPDGATVVGNPGKIIKQKNV